MDANDKARHPIPDSHIVSAVKQGVGEFSTIQSGDVSLYNIAVEEVKLPTIDASSLDAVESRPEIEAKATTMNGQSRFDENPKICYPIKDLVGTFDGKCETKSEDLTNMTGEHSLGIQTGSRLTELDRERSPWGKGPFQINSLKKDSYECEGSETLSKKRSRSLGSPVAFRNEEKSIYFQPRKKVRHQYKLGDKWMVADGPVAIEPPSPAVNDTLSKSTTSTGMFDDAEEDKTFDSDMYLKSLATKVSRKRAAKKNIDPKVIEALLGGTPESSLSDLDNPFVYTEKRENNSKAPKTTVNKKPKRLSTDKEKKAAFAIFDGEVDLLQILPREDCDFLGRECFIFTLKQLEWILDDDESKSESSSRSEVRDEVKRMLNVKYSAVNTSRKFTGSLADQTVEVETICDKLQNSLPTSNVASMGEYKPCEVQINDGSIEADKFKEWKGLIESWKLAGKPGDNATQFPLLDGPMSRFFPLGTLQFLESIQIKFAFEFFCLRRTESGLAIEKFQAWRKKCKLEHINTLPLSKHLIAIGTRIEESLKGNLIGKNERSKWITGPLVVLTGAAKEFIVDHKKIFTASDFINTRTKILSEQFSEWRSRSGLSELKGSGKVAMISAWKTQVKEEVEIESSVGSVVPAEELTLSGAIVSENNFRKDIFEKKKSIRPTKKKSKLNNYKIPAAREALDSPAFLADFFADEKKMEMVKSVGISTARQFLEENKGRNSNLLKAILKMKKDNANAGKQVLESSCMSLLYEWGSKIKKRIDNIESGKSHDREVQPSSNPPKRAPISRKRDSTNPFDALSATSKEFLKCTMNIETAEAFLGARTTDISSEYIKWRERTGRPILKGLGAVASISAWKTLVRNKVAIDGLSPSELNSDEKIRSLDEELKTASGNPILREKKIENLLESLITEPTKMNEAKRAEKRLEKAFSIVSKKFKNDEFYFHLDSGGSSSFLRYLGNGRSTRNTKKYDLVPVELKSSEATKNSIGRRPFRSEFCGTIDLGGVLGDRFVSKTNNEIDSRLTLEEVITYFVFQKKQILPETENPKRGSVDGFREVSASETSGTLRSTNYTLFQVLRKGQKKFVFSSMYPIEKGQTLTLRLFKPKNLDSSWFGEPTCEAMRLWIEDYLENLPESLLVDLVHFLKDEISPHIRKHLELIPDGTGMAAFSEADGYFSSSTSIRELLVARRRLHWVMSKICQPLRRHAGPSYSKCISKDLVWTKAFVDNVRSQFKFDETQDVLPAIMDEVRQEIAHEFKNGGKDIAMMSSKYMWSKMAHDAFESALNFLVAMIAKSGEILLENDSDNEYCSLFSNIFEALKSTYQSLQSGDTSTLANVIVPCNKDIRQHSTLFPSFQEVLQDVYIGPYTDAMELCNEPVSRIDSVKEVKLIAVKKLCGPTKNATACFLDVETMKVQDKIEIDVDWYAKTQIVAIAFSVMQCGLFVNKEESSEFLNKIKSLLIQQSQLIDEGAAIELPLFEGKNEKRYHFQSPKEISVVIPPSAPFFYGFIWPQLRKRGWKFTTGDTPSNLSFFTPADAKIQSNILDRKDSFARQRSQLARQTSALGLGYIPKQTKRILIHCEEIDSHIPCADAANHDSSAKHSLKLFVSKMISNGDTKSDSVNSTKRQKLDRLVIEIESLFNALAPVIFDETHNITQGEGKHWIDILDCRFLFKFLIALPNLLEQAKVPLQSHQQTMALTFELLNFLSDEYRQVFPGFFHLANEEYDSESRFPSRLMARLTGDDMKSAEQMRNTSSGSESDLSVEIIGPKDRMHLTDFIAIVLDQTILAIASKDDRNKAGQACIVCRHCLGVTSGKYFYASPESLASAATVFEKHLLKCQHVSASTKQEIMKTKTYHSKQRKNLPVGTQAAFFNKVYDRLKSLSHSGLPLPQYTPPPVTRATKSNHIRQTKDSMNVFKSHVDVMDYIQSTEPWKNDKLLNEVVSKYYNCLDYGGRIFNTEKRPTAFSSEWLYSKLTC